MPDYKIKIRKKDCRKNDAFKNEPLSYRVSIAYDITTEEIVITREFYRVGFCDGERWDEIYMDYDMSWKDMLGIRYASIMTRNMDKEYHIEIEKKLIETYYDNCFKSIDNVDKEIKKITKSLKSQKENYIDVISALDKTFRKEKINKILGELEEHNK